MWKLTYFMLRVEARLLGQVRISETRYMGYCSEHRQFYQDLRHTNGSIRCPDCDRVWLKSQGIVKKVTSVDWQHL